MLALLTLLLSGCGQDGEPVVSGSEPVPLAEIFGDVSPTHVAMAPNGDGVLIGGTVEGAVITGTCSAKSCERSPQPKLFGTYAMSVDFVGNGTATGLLHALTCSTASEPCPPEQLSLELFRAERGHAPVATIALTDSGLEGSAPVVRGIGRGPESAVITVADSATMTSMVFVINTNDGTFTTGEVAGVVVALSPDPSGSVVLATRNVDENASIGGGPVAPPSEVTAPVLTPPAGASGSGGSGDDFEPGRTSSPPAARIEIFRLDADGDIETVRTMSSTSDATTRFLATDEGMNLISSDPSVAVDAVTGEEVGEVAARPAPETASVTDQFCAGSVPGAVLVDTSQVLPKPQSTTLSFTYPATDGMQSATLKRSGLVAPDAACAVNHRLFVVVTPVPASLEEVTPPQGEDQQGGPELVVL